MGKVKADDLVRQTGGLWTKACEVDFLGHEFRLMESREAPAIRPDGFRVTWYSSQGLVIASVVAVMVVMSTGLWAYKHFTPQGQDIGRNLDRAVELPPRQDPEQNDANFYSARASNWSSKKNHAAARKDYDEAIRLDPGNANLYALRADTCLAMGEFDAAIKDFDVAIGMQPNALSYSGRAHAWRGKKNYELAIKDIDVALRHVAPDSFWAKWFKKDRDEMRNIVIISKVQEFVDAHPQIEEMSQFGSLGNSRWERATRPFRVGKTLTRIQQEELLDFLGIVAKYERHKSDPSFAEVVRELKDLTFPNP
jgi:tetratricopeptide (TPR) repeat protein